MNEKKEKGRHKQPLTGRHLEPKPYFHGCFGRISNYISDILLLHSPVVGQDLVESVSNHLRNISAKEARKFKCIVVIQRAKKKDDGFRTIPSNSHNCPTIVQMWAVEWIIEWSMIRMVSDAVWHKAQKIDRETKLLIFAS